MSLPHHHKKQEVPNSSVSPATAPATLQFPTLASSSCSSPLAFPHLTDCKDTHCTLSGSIRSQALCMPLLATLQHSTSAIILGPDAGWTMRISLRSTNRSLRIGLSRNSKYNIGFLDAILRCELRHPEDIVIGEEWHTGEESRCAGKLRELRHVCW